MRDNTETMDYDAHDGERRKPHASIVMDTRHSHEVRLQLHPAYEAPWNGPGSGCVVFLL